MSTSNNRYPQQLKESIVRRYLSTDASFRQLALETGAHDWTIRDWVRQYREQGSVGKKRNKTPASTDKRSAADKLRILLQVKALPEEERGALMRSEGVHDGDLERWEREAMIGLGGAPGETQSRRVLELERENKHQRKRLKEAAALLELQKKVQALWADEDDDTSRS